MAPWLGPSVAAECNVRCKLACTTCGLEDDVVSIPERWTCGAIAKQGLYIPLAVWVIRRRYEDRDEKYSGFQPKSELLWKVVDVHDKFTHDMKVYESIVDMGNPEGGLLTALQK